MKPKLLAQGAEAKIVLKDGFVIKDRVVKSYRIGELDLKIRTRRTKAETKLLGKAAGIINCVKPEKVKDAHKIKMGFIDGQKLSECLDGFSLAMQKKIMRQVGEQIAKLHESQIIHSDLTTSNMILKDDKVYFIDFGLGYVSHRFEDKAVDLHLLKQALEARHFKNWRVLFKEVETAYKRYKDSSKVFERLRKVEKRGRYRH